MATTIYTRTYTQLTAAGSTASTEVSNLSQHSFQVKVASINTNVVVNVDGSMDGTNFFTVPLVNTAVASLALSANLATITANGTYLLQASGKMK